MQSFGGIDRSVQGYDGGHAGGKFPLAACLTVRAASQTAAAACSARVSMRAHRCFTAWNCPIGRPNWCLSLA